MFEGVCVGLMFERVDLLGFGNDFTERAFDICRFEFSLSLGMVSRREDLMFEIVGFIVLGNKCVGFDICEVLNTFFFVWK